MCVWRNNLTRINLLTWTSLEKWFSIDFFFIRERNIEHFLIRRSRRWLPFLRLCLIRMLDFVSQRACQCLVQNVVGHNKSYVDSVPLLEWTEHRGKCFRSLCCEFWSQLPFTKIEVESLSLKVLWFNGLGSPFYSIDHYLCGLILRIMSFLRSFCSGQSRITGVIHKSTVFRLLNLIRDEMWCWGLMRLLVAIILPILLSHIFAPLLYFDQHHKTCPNLEFYGCMCVEATKMDLVQPRLRFSPPTPGHKLKF